MSVGSVLQRVSSPDWGLPLVSGAVLFSPAVCGIGCTACACLTAGLADAVWLLPIQSSDVGCFVHARHWCAQQVCGD